MLPRSLSNPTLVRHSALMINSIPSHSSLLSHSLIFLYSTKPGKSCQKIRRRREKGKESRIYPKRFINRIKKKEKKEEENERINKNSIQVSFFNNTLPPTIKIFKSQISKTIETAIGFEKIPHPRTIGFQTHPPNIWNIRVFTSMEQSAVLLCDFIAEDVSVRSFLAQGSSTRGRKSNRPRQIVEISNRRTGSRGDPAAFDRFNRTRIRPTLAILLGVIAWKRGCRLFFPPLFFFFSFFSQPSPVPRKESSLSLSLLCAREFRDSTSGWARGQV